jgi:hypothetical protein
MRSFTRRWPPRKNAYSVYLMSVYGHKPAEEKLRVGFKAAGKRLDMGKSCVRFRTLEDLPLDVIGEAVAAVPLDKYARLRARCMTSNRVATDGGDEPMDKVNLADKLARITEHWRPKVVGELNGQEVKLVKFLGDFVWHHHDHADELFLVIRGAMRVEFRDHVVALGPGVSDCATRRRAPNGRRRRS